MAMTLVEGGYLSARNAISVSVVQMIRDGRPAGEEFDVEEVLRRLSGLIGEALPRWAKEDLELDGVRVHAGDMVLARLEAANQDPRHFAEPGTHLPGRPGKHLAFGHGAHYCLGAALARLEVSAVLRALGDQLPDLRLATPVEEIPWTHGFADSGPAAVQLTW